MSGFIINPYAFGGGGGGGTEYTIVSRTGGTSFASFSQNTYQEIEPDANVVLAGLRTEEFTETGYTLKAFVWEVGNTTALASSDGVTISDGVYYALFGSAVTLSTGTRYRVGWVKTAGTENLRYVNSGGSAWSGFTVYNVYYRNTDEYPTSSIAGGAIFDLILET